MTYRIRNLAVVALLACACAHPPSLSEAIGATQSALTAVEISSGVAAQAWAQAVDARIEQCEAKQLQTQQARADCMGPLGRGQEANGELQALSELYDEIAQALQDARAVAERIESALAQERP
jgi:hypothetical protein